MPYLHCVKSDYVVCPCPLCVRDRNLYAPQRPATKRRNSREKAIHSARKRARSRKKRVFICEVCLVNPKEEVHHIKPLASFTTSEMYKANELDNLVAICKECHAEEHALP